ncbi:hypothetical protein Slin15195_G049940 [Septoria linicola]|uniref:Uncharacterized protein n=1 Tax=Septoria linicola TaxID=215465 RepID=A0A9Q9EI56_9PEZI|nr:hypothetical protein Slin15195_G049940 [Septoria linicola]
MTAHVVPMARVPFAPLDNPRLAHLASAKNRQNGVLKTGLANNAKTSMKSAVTSNKRAYEPSTFDEFDSENVDPAMFDSPAKKSKGSAFTFTTAKSMPPPTMRTPLRANVSSPRAPSTAPAGRSPKRKLAGMKSQRRISAPFGRVDPPSFSSASALPFSLDAALNGSLPSAKKSEGATIAESMPKNWFFEIYEDTPEEEAANLMEHSTLTLDLSSDDEGEKKIDYRGKENTPPEGYDAPSLTREEIVRKKVVVEEMDDGARSPLSEIEAESFIPEGVKEGDYVVVDDSVEEVVKAVKKDEVVKGEVVKEEEVVKEVLPAVENKAGEIVVWEDESA